MLCAKFCYNWPCRSREEDEKGKSTTGVRWSEKLSCTFNSGEFKTDLNTKYNCTFEACEMYLIHPPPNLHKESHQNSLTSVNQIGNKYFQSIASCIPNILFM